MAAFRLAIVVTHAPWDAKRRVSLAAIRRRLVPRVDAVDPRIARFAVQPDYDRAGIYENTLRSLRLLATVPDATHHLELNDDILPCPYFLDHIEAAVAARPDHLVCFFTMRGLARKVDRTGRHWFHGPLHHWGGSVVTPAWMTADFLAWQAAHVDRAYKWPDGAWGAWARAHGHDYWVTVPSLAEHALPGDSLVGNSNRTRVASCPIPHPQYPLDWTLGLDDAPRETGTIGNKIGPYLR